MSKTCLATTCLLLLAACHAAEKQAPKPQPGQKVLRAIYRGQDAIMLLALPDGPGGLPRGDCAQPLLIDPATGAAHAISASEAAERQKTMQLAGASEGTCPVG